MARRQPWEEDIADALKHERWSLHGAGRPVKVTPLHEPLRRVATGYFTVAAYLSGLTPSEMEGVLGLPNGFLALGARIYPFLRLPNFSEYDYELTAKYPDGLAFVPWLSNPSYPPGSDQVHQWRLLPGCTVAVDPQHYIAVRPGNRFEPPD